MGRLPPPTAPYRRLPPLPPFHSRANSAAPLACRRNDSMTCGARLLKQLPAAFLGAVLVLAFQSSLAAQAQATTGVIRGGVSDASGNVVAGARVSVTDVDTRFQRTVFTNEKGVFVAPLLPLGTYEVTARGVGLGEREENGTVLRVGEAVALAFR